MEKRRLRHRRSDEGVEGLAPGVTIDGVVETHVAAGERSGGAKERCFRAVYLGACCGNPAGPLLIVNERVCAHFTVWGHH